jgi:hypothetical protein
MHIDLRGVEQRLLASAGTTTRRCSRVRATDHLQVARADPDHHFHALGISFAARSARLQCCRMP